MVTNMQNDMLEIRPNLFEFATSELSQDAFICWLLSWAEPDCQRADAVLHECAAEVLKTFFELHKKPFPSSIRTLKVDKQYKHIDVICILNEEYFILIEDKTTSQENNDQLARYLKEIHSESKYDKENVLPIFLKTHEQASYKKIEEVEYRVFDREAFLRILDNYADRIRSDIFGDYRRHLRELDNKINSFETLPVDKWHRDRDRDRDFWSGFYRSIQHELGDAGHPGVDWNYVPNPAGGFLALWWFQHRDKEDGCVVYLQLEQHRLCFKIYSENKDKGERSAQRWKVNTKLRERAGEHGLSLVKPKRFGSGTWMTAAVSAPDGKYLVEKPDGTLDREATLKTLKAAEALMTDVFSR